MRLDTPMLSPEAVQMLSGHDYPGNIRELKNVVERALIESRGGDIGPEHLQLGVSRAPQASSTTVQDAIDALPLNFGEVEAGLMARALRETKGNVAAAARLLDVDRNKLYRRLRAAGLL